MPGLPRSAFPWRGSGGKPGRCRNGSLRRCGRRDWLHAVLLRKCQALEKKVRALVRLDARARRLMSTPGSRPTWRSLMPLRSTTPGAFARRSGRARISIRRVRTTLYEAAHIMLVKPLKGCTELKSWAMRIPAGRDEEGQGGAGAQAYGDPAPHAR